MERLPVHGTVKLASGEKFSGRIAFLPEKGQLGPAANTNLVEGRYTFDRINGPTAGPHRVIVTRTTSGSRIPERLADKQPMPTAKTEWTESRDVSNDGRYLHDFTLED